MRLFYSYSHKDVEHRADLETVLDSLRQRGLLRGWSDAQIVPGRSISASVRAELSDSDIVACLLSPDYISSAECRKEWERASEMASSGRLVFRVPIILRPCAWQDFLGADDVKALPADGRPITTSPDRDSAWHEVYEGIKLAVESVRTTYTPKPNFLEQLNDADLPLSKTLALDDIFVFPRLVEHDYTTAPDIIRESPISSVDQLRTQGHAFIHGEDKSGKTALAKHFAQTLIKSDHTPLFVDLGGVTGRLGEKLFRDSYGDQYTGDYDLWNEHADRTLVLDNVTPAPGIVEFLQLCADRFSQTIAFVSSDIFQSYLMDDKRLAEYRHIRIEELTRSQQEELIRNRLGILDRDEPITDGYIDQAERRVNSVIISSKIVPRHPFFVLAILETYAQAMPQSLSITSYGHCYYIFILASLRRAGIAETDDAINSALNFAEQLALSTFRASKAPGAVSVDFSEFQDEYRSEYYMEDSLLNRLTHNEYGIITSDGKFKTAYMYYYFLGKLLASNPVLADQYLPELCEHSYSEGEYLALLFAIHHATDIRIIEEIVLMTMVDLDHLPVATLDEDETRRFASIVSELPRSVLSASSVEEERAREREVLQDLEEAEGEEPQRDEDDEDVAVAQAMLRVLKNNRILGQVLRNQYGKLPKREIEQIVQTIADSSLRLVNVLLKDEEEIRELAEHIHARCPEADLWEVQQMLGAWSFLWTMINIEHAVQAVSFPGVRDAIDEVVERNGTPAYELFGYFCKLDSGEQLTWQTREELTNLYNQHPDEFVRRVLSIRTQWYMNTHRSSTRIEQSICSFLGIGYRFRPRSIAPASIEC